MTNPKNKHALSDLIREGARLVEKREATELTDEELDQVSGGGLLGQEGTHITIGLLSQRQTQDC